MSPCRPLNSRAYGNIVCVLLWDKTARVWRLEDGELLGFGCCDEGQIGCVDGEMLAQATAIRCRSPVRVPLPPPPAREQSSPRQVRMQARVAAVEAHNTALSLRNTALEARVAELEARLEKAQV